MTAMVRMELQGDVNRRSGGGALERHRQQQQRREDGTSHIAREGCQRCYSILQWQRGAAEPVLPTDIPEDREPRRDAAPWLGTTAFAQSRGEVLYNGIHLGTPWPPNNRYFSPDPIEPPYLADPPAVIPIDLGRQLFVDDFLIEESSLARTFHRAVYHPASPVLRPETPWERRDEYADRTQTKPNPAAMVFSDGVVFDPKDRLFKMWYMGGYGQNTCLATSTDGINWDRPTFDVVKGTNIVVRDLRDSSTVWLDHDNLDGGGRYKLAYYNGSEGGIILQTSDDGVHWQRRGLAKNRGDRSTFFWNPFRKVWVFSLRDDVNGQDRHRRYYETRDFASASWDAAPPPLWTGADALDAATA